MSNNDASLALNILLQTLKENPDLWETRKKTAKLLYEEKQYNEAADILWNAPEIPATDVDVAFALKVISRVKPNRSIRLIYEVIRRNKEKPHKHMAVARALNSIGMYMEAARFYGAALATDPALFDLGFERQMLWLDDSGRLVEEWKESDQDSKPPLNVPEQELPGGMITPDTIPNADGSPASTATEQPAAAASPVAAPATRPLMVAGGSPPLPAASPATPAVPKPVATQPLLTPGVAAPKSKPLLQPGAAPSAPKPLLSPGATGASTQPLLTPGLSAPTSPAPLRQAVPSQQQQMPAQNPATQPMVPPSPSPAPQNLTPPGMGVRSDSQPMAAPNNQPPLPQRPASMISSPPVATQPLVMPQPVARPMTQPVAYVPVGTQPLGVAPVSTQPLGMVPQRPISQPIGRVPVSTQPLAYAPPAMPQQMIHPQQQPAAENTKFKLQ